MLAVKEIEEMSIQLVCFPLVPKERYNDNVERRERQDILIQATSLVQRDLWITKISSLIPPTLQSSDGTSLVKQHWKNLIGTEEDGHLLVLLNPASGEGSTALAWGVVEPILRLAPLELTFRCKSQYHFLSRPSFALRDEQSG